MAVRPRVSVSVGTSAGLKPFAVDPDSKGRPTADVLTSMYKAIQGLLSLLGGGRVTLGTGEDATTTGLVDGQWLTVTTPATPDEPFPVPHGLGRIPLGFNVWNTDVAVRVYRDTTRPWTTELVWLRADVASANILVSLI